MLAEMSCGEFDEWYQYYSEQPFSYQEDRQMRAQLIAATYNASGRYKKAFEANDFLPDGRPLKPKSIEHQLSEWRVLAG